MQLDFSRLRLSEALGVVAGALLVLALFVTSWYSLSDAPFRSVQDAWLCGEGDLSCTGFETFPILRWLLIAGATAPLILAWIVVRGHKLSWAPGEMTMVVGFTAFVLIAYNGIIDRPGSGVEEIGVGLSYGYWIALASAIAIAVTGFWRSMESGAGAGRRAPGTV